MDAPLLRAASLEPRRYAGLEETSGLAAEADSSWVAFWKPCVSAHMLVKYAACPEPTAGLLAAQPRQDSVECG